MDLIALSKPLMKHIMSWMHHLGSLLTFGLPCAFVLLLPKSCVDVIVASKKVPDYFNPWFGLFALYVWSSILVGVAIKLRNAVCGKPAP